MLGISFWDVVSFVVGVVAVVVDVVLCEFYPRSGKRDKERAVSI